MTGRAWDAMPASLMASAGHLLKVTKGGQRSHAMTIVRAQTKITPAGQHGPSQSTVPADMHIPAHEA
jgi:hypothetical protein